MPDSPQSEVARRRALRENTLRGKQQYHGKPRVPAIGGNTHLPADERQTVSKFYLEDYPDSSEDKDGKS
jgi:hypothetical protein